MTFNTGNPVGSTDARDLHDNAERMDIAINSDAETFQDRLGKTRLTLAGMASAASTGNPAIGAAAEAFASAALAEQSAHRAESEAVRAETVAQQVDSTASAAAQNAADLAVQGVATAVADSVERAETAADVAQLAAGVYETTSAGLAATVSGGYFNVPSGSAGESLILYRNSAGAAVEVKRYPSSAALDGLSERNAPYTPGAQQLVPLFVTSDGKVPLWLEDGLLAAKGLSPALSAGLVPPVTVPAYTDSRTMYKWRARLTTAAGASPTGLARVALLGDSWAEMSTIPSAMKAMVSGGNTDAGGSWQSVSINNRLGGAFTRSAEWNYVDGGAVDISGQPTGIDGQAIYTTSAVATATLSGVNATEFKIYYRKGSGTFRYRIDGGSWVAVVGDNSNTLGVVSLAGLANTSHTIDFDTTGNSGTAYLLGVYAKQGSAGIEVLKIGNSGLRGSMLRKWVSNVGPIAATLDIDLAIIILGTNDYRYADSTVSEYKSALRELIVQLRAGTPTMSILLVAPADTAGSSVTPLTSYRDAMYAVANLDGCEFLNMHDMFGLYAQTNALGLWADDLHLNSTGARTLSSLINNHFMRVKE